MHSKSSPECFRFDRGGLVPWSAVRDAPSEPVGNEIRSISIGWGTPTSCFVLGSGEVRCSGNNVMGETGVKPPPIRIHDPVPVAGIGPARQVVTATRFSCALLETGEVTCWGDPMITGGPLGMAYKVRELPGIAKMAAGPRHVCAITRSQEVYCWGSFPLPSGGYAGPSAAKIPLPSAAVDLAVGQSMTCVLMRDGTHRCWGMGAYCGGCADGKGFEPKG